MERVGFNNVVDRDKAVNIDTEKGNVGEAHSTCHAMEREATRDSMQSESGVKAMNVWMEKASRRRGRAKNVVLVPST